MKQLIVPVAIIALLIVFFVIVDRKEFNRCNDYLSVQQENVSTNGKTDISVPDTMPVTEMRSAGETKTMDTNPLIKTTSVVAGQNVETNSEEIKSADKSKPVAEEKPVIEPKPTESKHVTDTQDETAESKSVADANSEGEKKPIAVPVVSSEEAEKLNTNAIEYAIAEKEKREPFYNYYENSKLKTVYFEGTVRVASVIPVPEKNDYDNCLYALFVEIDSILSEIAPNTKIACEVIINVPIMKDKNILQHNRFLPGDKISCRCAEYDEMPQAIQEIQLSDDIQAWEHEQYYPLEIKKIAAFRKDGNKNFSKREITILPIQKLPKDEKATTLRNERIQNEIARIEEELKKHGGSFEIWKEEYKPVAEKIKQLANESYRCWINDSYFVAGIKEPVYKTDDFINKILPYKEYLDKNNIDLIFLRVPHKSEFSGCVLASTDFQENPAWIEHYYKCLKNDIEIIDPMPAMWEHRFDFPLFYFYNVDTELHPFEGQAFVSAKTVADVLKRYDYKKNEQQILLEKTIFKSKDPRFYWPKGNEKFNPQENVSFNQVVCSGKPIGDLEVNSGSPFMFLSNSLFWFPQRPLGASTPGYTAYFIQHIPDWFYQSGIDNAMIRNLISDRNALSNRKAIIMVGHYDCWNGSIPSFPKYIQDNAKSLVQEKKFPFLSPEIKIIDDGSFVFTEKDNIVYIVQNINNQNANKSFSIELSIPSMEEKSTCMLRINYVDNSYITMVVTDSEKNNKSTIDQSNRPV